MPALQSAILTDLATVLDPLETRGEHMYNTEGVHQINPVINDHLLTPLLPQQLPPQL